MELEARFWEKVAWGDPDECWDWVARRSGGGYGQFRLSGSIVTAHRVAYELEVGEVPPGLVIDHLCGNRACCNPQHLEPVTQLENVRRGLRVNGAKCLRGHLISRDFYVDPKGVRVCNVCRRAKAAEWRERNRDRINQYKKEWLRASKEKDNRGPEKEGFSADADEP